jgi:hypothetical protein
MCQRCRKIDEQIASYEAQLKQRSFDNVFMAGLDEVLRNFCSEKTALHPESDIRYQSH